MKNKENPEPMWCCRCGRKKDVYTTLCTNCLAKIRANNYRVRGPEELIEATL